MVAALVASPAWKGKQVTPSIHDHRCELWRSPNHQVYEVVSIPQTISDPLNPKDLNLP